MLIRELKLSRSLKRSDAIDPNTGNIRDILERSGWKILGHGQESLVAENPNKSYVLKLYDSTSKYTAFVNHVKDNQGNQHYPKFGRYVREVPGTQFSYVRMEKLSKTNPNELMKSYFPELCGLMMVGKKYGFQMLGSSLWNDYVPNKLRDDYNLMVKSYNGQPPSLPDEQQRVLSEISKDVGQDWTEVCWDLYDLGKKELKLKWLDLHVDNFMKRGNVLVVADPFYD